MTQVSLSKQSKPACEGGTPVRKGFLVFGRPHIEEAEIEEVLKTLRSGWISTGPRVAAFEEQFRKYLGCRHAMALNSCTAALHLALLALGIRRDDEVITTPLTFAATANVILHVGAVPVFADVDPHTININPAEIEKKISRKTRAIIPVHFAGNPCNMKAILDIAHRHKIAVVEDAAHAIGAEIDGKKCGRFGDLAAFSFYVTKNIVTGEGGMAVTDNTEWAEKIQMYGLHGLSRGAWKRYSDDGFKHYEVIYPGYKYNMMDLQAFLGLHQLPRIDFYIKQREEIWKKYNTAFGDLPVTLPSEPPKGIRHARHLYTVLLDLEKLKTTRDRVLQALHQENIGTGIHFVSLHLHRYYRETYGYKPSDFPAAEDISKRTLSLPLSPLLSDRDVNDVIEAFRKIIIYYKN